MEALRALLMRGHVGTCIGGPWDGFVIADGKPLIKLDGGEYRFLDGHWRWRGTLK